MWRTASWAWEGFDVLLIEADGKALFAEHGIPVPAGVQVTDVLRMAKPKMRS